jgi:hypothetical protein
MGDKFMKKVLMIFAGLLFSINTMADLPAGQQTVINDERTLEQYKSAAKIALNASDFDGCDGDEELSWDFDNPSRRTREGTNIMIEHASYATLSKGDDRSTLSFYTLQSTLGGDGASDNVHFITQIEMSSDGEFVESVNRINQELTDVNTGTLESPVISKQWRTVRSYSCK